MDRLSGKFSALAIAAGLCWRLAAAWPPHDASGPCLGAQEEYFLSSVILLSEKVWTTDPTGWAQAGRGPLYASFLALTQAGAPRPSPRRARFFQALLGACVALAAWALGAKLYSPAAGAFAAAFVALDPSLAAATRGLDVHGFYGAVILLLAAAAAWWAERGGDRASGAALGVALGLSFLCRSAHIAFVPLLLTAACVWWDRAGPRRAGWIFLVAAAVLLPWTLRNYAHTGRLILLDAGIGSYNLLAAADGVDHAVAMEEALAIAEHHQPGFGALHFAATGARQHEAVFGLARRVILEAPGRYAAGCLRRLLAFWRPLAVFLLLAGFAALTRGTSRGLQAAALLAAAFSSYAAIGLGEGYRLGVEPLMAALGGIGLAAILGRAGRAKSNRDPAWALIPAASAIGASALLCFLLTPFDALTSRRPAIADCAPPAPALAAFLDDGVRSCGEDWSLAHWPSALRARPDVCAGMAAYASGDMTAATTHFGAAAAKAPRDPAIRISLAVALAAAGDKPRARRESLLAEDLAARQRPSLASQELLESIRSTRLSLAR